MNTIYMSISGVTNSQKKTALKNALDKVEGVQSVDIDKMQGRITIDFNPPANETQIRDCITETGFRLV